MSLCSHLDAIKVAPPRPEEVAGCEECLKIGGRWLHLRACLTCGKVGCCDSSPNRHASAHAREASHPLVHSAEPGEEWTYCFIDDVAFVVDIEADPAEDGLQSPVDPEVDHWRGGSDAAVTMVMYGDYECPYTRLAYRSVQRIEPEMDDRLRFVFRHFPLVSKHPHAQAASEAAEAAAAQERFWVMHDQLFHRQRALAGPDLRGYAQELGLDLDQYDASLAERSRIAGRVARDTASGQRSGVSGTPTIFINDALYTDEREYANMLAALQACAA